MVVAIGGTFNRRHVSFSIKAISVFARNMLVAKMVKIEYDAEMDPRGTEPCTFSPVGLYRRWFNSRLDLIQTTIRRLTPQYLQGVS